MNSYNITERSVGYYKGRDSRDFPGTSLLHASIPKTFLMSAGLAEAETAIDFKIHEAIKKSGGIPA
jgi:hypothetical protein